MHSRARRRWKRPTSIAALLIPICMAAVACDSTITGGSPWPAFGGDTGGGSFSQAQGAWRVIRFNGQLLPQPVAFVDAQNQLELEESHMDVCGDSWTGFSRYTMTVSGSPSRQIENGEGRLDISSGQMILVREDRNESPKRVTFSGSTMFTTAPNDDVEEWQKTGSASC